MFTYLTRTANKQEPAVQGISNFICLVPPPPPPQILFIYCFKNLVLVLKAETGLRTKSSDIAGCSRIEMNRKNPHGFGHSNLVNYTANSERLHF